jgi:hypothetical protein
VELFNPFDELVKRIKIRSDSIGVFAGYVDLEEDFPEGSYTLRAYTRYMFNQGNEFFFKKKINVLDPYSLQIKPEVDFVVNDNKVDAIFHFFDYQQKDTITPEIVTITYPGEEAKTIKPRNKDYIHSFNINKQKTTRAILLGIVNNGRKFFRYYSIPYAANDFDVTFHPEGGYLVPGKTCQVTFKAINPSGLSEEITGVLYNAKNEEIQTFNTFRLGMGNFYFAPEAGEKYYAVCKTRNGTSKRFDLPSPSSRARIVNVNRSGNKVLISVIKGEEASNGPIALLIHHKGVVLYHKPWLSSSNFLGFPENIFPSGISSILLTDGNNEIISERLVFVHDKNDFPSIETDLSSPTYKKRELISLNLQLAQTDSLTDKDNIAISVVDKKTVVQDTTNHIVSSLLLSSELKGYIESPASYFSGTRDDQTALDMLMMTQGWRRYDIPNVIKGKIVSPELLPEQYLAISGKAEAVLFSSMKQGSVSMYATIDTFTVIETEEVDSKGRFLFKADYPDGVEITVQTLTKKEGQGNYIYLDSITYPNYTFATLPAERQSKSVDDDESDLDIYLKQANDDYVQQHGMRTIMLQEVAITAQTVQRYKSSMYYSPVSSSTPTTAEDVERLKISNMTRLIFSTSRATLGPGNIVTTTQSTLPALIVIDELVYENFDVLSMSVDDIDNIFVVKGSTVLFGYYPGTSGALVITTKSGFTENVKKNNIDRIKPLGYQQTAEFYAPKYETKEQLESSVYDQRTTIYWKPDVQFSADGKAVVVFYSADIPTTYQVVGEGVTGSGQVIRFTKEIKVVEN